MHVCMRVGTPARKRHPPCVCECAFMCVGECVCVWVPLLVRCTLPVCASVRLCVCVCVCVCVYLLLHSKQQHGTYHKHTLSLMI